MTTAVSQIAGVGLLPNPPADVGVALMIPPDLTSTLNSYNSLTTVALMGNIINEAATQAKAGNITFAEFNTIATIGQDNFPALTNVLSNNVSASQAVTTLSVSSWNNNIEYITGDYVTNSDTLFTATFNSRGKNPDLEATVDEPNPWIVDVNSYKLSLDVESQAGNIINVADNTKFAQVYSQLINYMDSVNERINVDTNAQLLDQTFTQVNGGMNYVTTGGVNTVTNNYTKFAEDLIKTGNLINFAQIQNFGLPSQLMAQMSAGSGRRVVELNELMIASGFTQSEINASVSGETPFTPKQEKSLYNILLGITGTVLSNIKALLGLSTPNIETAADLLDLAYIFPNSYLTLQCILTKVGLVPIYTQPLTVNNQLRDQFENDPVTTLYLGGGLNNSYTILSRILPPDAALAVKAFTNSISQIKNYTQLDIFSFSTALNAVKDNSDLDLINGLVTLIPTSVSNFYAQDLALGTGTGNTLVLDDMFGCITNMNVQSSYQNATTFINSISSELSDVDSAMTNLLTELEAGNSPTSLITSVESAIGNVVANNTSNVGNINVETLAVGNLVYRNVFNQRSAEMDWTELVSNDQQSSLALSEELGDIGTDASGYNTSVFFSRIANLNNLGGQAVEASLREGKNQNILNDAGVDLDAEIPNELL